MSHLSVSVLILLRHPSHAVHTEGCAFDVVRCDQRKYLAFWLLLSVLQNVADKGLGSTIGRVTVRKTDQTHAPSVLSVAL